MKVKDLIKLTLPILFLVKLKKRNKGYVGNVKMRIFWRNGYKIKSNTALLVEVISIWGDLNF
jgi:hypothetical protein